MAENSTVVSRTGSSIHELRSGSIAFIVGAIIFFSTSAIFIAFGGTPPSTTPVASIIGHAGWFSSVVCLAIGAISLLLRVESLRTGLAGYLSVGTLVLGVFAGLQWAIWAWMDVLAAQYDQYQLLLDGLISPFGSGLALMYGLLVAGGVGFLGWGIRPTLITHQMIGWSGTAIGIVALFGTGTVLLSASKNVLFAGVILVIPVSYLWILIFAIGIYRRQRKAHQ